METPTSPVPSPPLSGEDRLWGAIAHFSALSMYVTGLGFIVGPLIIWLWKRDTSTFVAEEAREALNFNLSVLIYYAIACILFFTVILIPLVFIFLILLHAFHLICIIVGGLKASDGIPFRYPFNLRLVK